MYQTSNFAERIAQELRYDLEPSRLGMLVDVARPLGLDAETLAWLAAHEAPRGWFKSSLVEVLSRFMSLYDAHGAVGGYPMHLLSSAQFEELLGDEHHRRLLDVGAGAGHVTAIAAPRFTRVCCSETSVRLARHLTKRGYDTFVGDLAREPAPWSEPFDVITCFNVLDRTPRPLSLMRQLVELLEPKGRLLVALPLPLRPHVHVPGATVSPEERLFVGGESLEEQASALTEHLFFPAGLVVERFARVPYLSQGDTAAPLYVLDDGLWVLRLR